MKEKANALPRQRVTNPFDLLLPEYEDELKCGTTCVSIYLPYQNWLPTVHRNYSGCT
ncbi:hypothetical protein [Mucilaginibacter pineti]|uniref:hypothetical protein n=1 Tax=Mucilaginibacter pineti TaxID=1391627 RepID=UPI0013BE9CED|nr:hypothetical protein [Mucilaginibacter pineti]